MELRPGSRWKSAVCDTEVVVVRPPSAARELTCGGQPMVAHAAERPTGLSPLPEQAAGSQLGKRYMDEATGFEALCSKGGAGSLALDGRFLMPKEAKKLPASD